MELNDLRSRMYRVGNYIKESTSKSLDGLKSDRRLGNLQDEINDAYRMLGYSIYTEMKTIDLESCDCQVLYKNNAEIIAKIDEKCVEIDQVKRELAAEAAERNVNSSSSIFCSNCGAVLPKNARFCGKCGKPVV